MKIKSLIPLALLLTIGMVSITGCQKGNLVDNPNVAASSGVVPPTLILNHLTAKMIRNDEQPFGIGSKASQDIASTYVYYFGPNTYSFGSTEDTYDILKYAIALQNNAGSTTNKYYALSQFFKAYAGIWLTERVGDIPFSQAGNPAILTPKYDTQHDVYKTALSLLSSANSIIAPLAAVSPNTKLDATGDIFGLTYLQWQKLINTYTLRVLIDLSKRASDNADLNITSSFATIVNNPTTYPIMTSNSDNLVYPYAFPSNPYATLSLGLQPYNSYNGVTQAYVNVTAPVGDPRLMLVSCPSINIVKGGVSASSFSAYVGLDPSQTVGQLQALDFKAYSHSNFNRYFVLPAAYSGANAEPFVFIGYPEMCFNIAEAINRGWLSGSAATWYNNGIAASLSLYKITDGQTLTIQDYTGATLGTATVNLASFLSNVAYSSDNTTALAQIFTQRYVALHLNSGFQNFMNWRRSVSSAFPNGLPTYNQNGPGIGTPNNLIVRRWQYPASEANENTTNYQAALQSQFGGTDDQTKDTWLTK
jgi:hypothetical protein